MIFQKSSYKNKPITQEPKSLKLLYPIMNLNTLSLPTKARPTKLKKRKEKENPGADLLKLPLD